MWNIMVSRELSLMKLVRTYLACILGFAVLYVILVKIGVEKQYAIMGGIVYAVVIALCFLIFAINWDVAIPNFREWREAQDRKRGER